MKTFLFTDVEGSTRLWERFPEGMSSALAFHDTVSREAVRRHSGHVVKMSGDGMHAVFDAPLAALSAALHIQVRLAELEEVSLRVRAGVHTGEAEERDGDFYGPAVNRAARIADAAHGGQVLVSEATRQRLGDLAAPLGLRGLGLLRLRDLTTAETVHQLLHPALRDDFPPTRSLATTPNNLPHLLTSLVGRRKELGTVHALFERARLVTLVGPGGIGKTRLALQAAAHRLDRHRDGVWFVELADLAEGARLPSTIARTLGVRDAPGSTDTQRLVEHLAPRETLVVLDTCEHLVEACAHLADTLLRAAPGLRILATSRRALEIDGEAHYGVPPLAIPDPDFPSGLANLLDVESARLFVDRAGLHAPAFSVGEADAVALARILFRLDGIPLAVELAAARMRTHSLAQVDRGLDDRFGLLVTGSRVAPPRHKTLRALIEWSYQLLDAPSRELFARLGVFGGGWTRAAAELVCGEYAARLDALVRESLVVDIGGGRMRYLDTLRDYAMERLEASGEAARWRDRHAGWMEGEARDLRARLAGSGGKALAESFHEERDNWRAALATLCGAGPGSVSRALRLACDLSAFWWTGGYVSEGREWLARVLAAPESHAEPLLRAQALEGAGALAYMQGDLHTAREYLEEAATLFRRHGGDPHWLGRTLAGLGYTGYVLGGWEPSRHLFEEAAAVLEASGNASSAAQVLTNAADNAMYAGDLEAACAYVARAEGLVRGTEDLRIQASIAQHHGVFALRRGDLARAGAQLERHLELCEQAGDRARAGIGRAKYGMLKLRAGDSDSALALHREAIDLLHEAGMRMELINALESLALVLAERGKAEAALQLHAATGAARDRIGFPVGRQARSMREAVEAALGEPAGHSARASGGTIDELVDYARAVAV